MKVSHLRTLAIIAVTIATIVSIGVTPTAAQQAPGEPVNFYGEVVDEDGNNAPVGTTIVAVVDNEVEGEVVVDTAGQYGEEGAFGKKLALDSNAGETVSFHIDDPNGAEAVESPRDLNAGTFEFDLTFPAGTFEDEAAVESISIDLNDNTITEGDETGVTVTSTLDDGSTEEVTDESDIESDDISIATIDGESIVGEGSGTATIEVEYAGSTATTDITVEDGETEDDSDGDDDDNSDNSDDSDDGSGGGQDVGAGGGTTTDDSDSTDDDTGDDGGADDETTVADVNQAVSESEASTETEINLDEVANEDDTDSADGEEGVTVDTSEETESVQEITFQDENVEGTVTIEEYSDSEVTETTTESIEQTIADDVSEGIQDGEESGDGDVAESDDNGGSAGDSSGGTTTESVNVATVASISVDDPDTAATVTMSVDADEISDPQSATIFHETENNWQELPTEVEEQSNGEITLSGETDGFSLFAVAEVTQEANDETTESTESTDGETNDGTADSGDGETDDGIPGFGVTAALIALVGVALFTATRQQAPFLKD